MSVFITLSQGEQAQQESKLSLNLKNRYAVLNLNYLWIWKTGMGF